MVDHSPGGQQQPRHRADYRIPAIEKYAYCLCLHVKPTTIFIAVFKLIRALLFASILLNTEFAVSEHGEIGLTIDSGHKSTAAAVNILARIIVASVSAVGIYAVISGRAALLMPLYAILLVDFFFSLPAFYNRETDPAFSVDNMGDLRSHQMPTNNQYTRYSMVLFSTLVMIIKIYFLCVIWKCYRYLRLIELVSPIIYPSYQGSPCPIRILGRPEQDLNDVGGNGNNIAPPPYESIASSMKPPNYEEAMKATIACPIYPTSAPPTIATTTTTAVALSDQQRVIITNVNTDQQSTLQHHEQSPPQQQQQQTSQQQFNPQISNDSFAISITTDNSDAPTTTNATSNNVRHQIITSSVQRPQDMTESTAQPIVTQSSTVDKSTPSIVIVDSNESRDKH